MNPGRYRRLAVLPFTDPRGQGPLIAAKLNKGLFERGFATVDLHQIDSLFKNLKLDFSGGLGLNTVTEIRQATLAEALLFGSVDSDWRQASLIMIETEYGDVVFNAKIRPRRGGAFSTPDQIAEEVLRLFPASGSAGQVKPFGPDLPEPE